MDNGHQTRTPAGLIAAREAIRQSEPPRRADRPTSVERPAIQLAEALDSIRRAIASTGYRAQPHEVRMAIWGKAVTICGFADDELPAIAAEIKDHLDFIGDQQPPT